MTIKAVDVVQARQEYKEKKAKKGGGALGQAIGGVLGGVAGGVAAGAATVATGGAAAGTIGMGIAGGAAAGASVGGMIGERIKPSREGSMEAINRRSAGYGPQLVKSDNSEKLKQSLLALQGQPEDVKAEYTKPLVTAYVTSVAAQHPKKNTV